MTPEERDLRDVQRAVGMVKAFIRFFEAVRWHRAPMGLVTFGAPLTVYLAAAHTRFAAIAGIVGLPLLTFWLHQRRAPRALVTYGWWVTLASVPLLCWLLFR